MPNELSDSLTTVEDAWFSYAILRVVPRVERGEFVNVGVIVFARTLGFLETWVQLDDNRLHVFAPGLDLVEVKRHLDGIVAISRGLPTGGPMAHQPRSERFHWLTSPRSTVIQASPIHVGRTTNAAATVDALLNEFVRALPPA